MAEVEPELRSSTGQQPRPVPTSWFAAKHLKYGTFRDSSPAWREEGGQGPERALAVLQWTVTQCVQNQFGKRPGVALAKRLGTERQLRSLQERLSGQERLRPADLEAWSEHVRFPESILNRETQTLSADWQPILIKIALRTSVVAWTEVANQLSELLSDSTKQGWSRLLTSASFAYLGVAALTAAGTAPVHVRLVDGDHEALHLRIQGRTHHVVFEWAPDGDDARWEDWIYTLHNRLAHLLEMVSAERLVVAALGPSRLGLLDVWSPPAAMAVVPSTLRITADAMRSLGVPLAAEIEEISLDLLARQAWAGGDLLVLRVTPDRLR